MEKKQVLQGFIEPPLHFKPTYKLDIGKDTYDSGLKRRIPAWTDRILYGGRLMENKPEHSPIQCIHYNADFSLNTSDHRPVAATFVVDWTPGEADHQLLELLHTGDDQVIYKEAIEYSSPSQVCTLM